VAGDVFISYSRRDQEFVYRMVDDLEDRRAAAWVDRGSIHGGERWRASIESGIRECKAFVLIISPESIASNNVGEEIATALRFGKPIIPIIYRNAAIPAALNAQLREFQVLDFTKGAYAENLLDLVDGLVALRVAIEVDRAALAVRHGQRLGAGVGTDWGAVFGRIPKWALAWGIGWALLGLIVSAVLFVVQGSETASSLLYLAPGAFVGGFIGGLIAGFITMLSLRHNAASIRWKHISPAIRIWGLVGSVGVVAAGVVTFVVVEVPKVDSRPCVGDFGQCLGQGLGEGLAAGIAYAFALAIFLFLLLVVVVFAIGVVAAILAVRAIRRLEPGIALGQSVGVLAGWGFGSVVAVIASVLATVLISNLITGGSS